MNYWDECISEAFEDAGIAATPEQIETVAAWVEGAHDNYGMAHGHDAIPNPVVTQATEELAKMKREKQQYDDWHIRTKPCKSCITTGWVLDGWGREQTCLDCSGKGRD